MSKTPDKHDQLSLTLRIAAGGYLLYSAWKLREAIAEKPLFLIFIVLFVIAGAFIAGHAAWRLWKGQYDQPGVEGEEESEESEK